ncbi:hypothetical protein FB451DRAFT_1166807 [Mycena latifolia]|nr:hypothetical protein FB451DRAFT_1166807 [Mycena latifolia]
MPIRKAAPAGEPRHSSRIKDLPKVEAPAQRTLERPTATLLPPTPTPRARLPRRLPVQQGKGFTANEANRATIIAKVGCIVGGLVCGWLSQPFGRHATIIVVSLVDSWGTLTAGAFLLQFCVQAVVPIHLSELSSPQFRATFPGITYQIGNMISSPAAQILSTSAESKLVFYKGKFRPDYARSQWGMMSAIFLLLAFWLAIGHEELGSRFELVARAGHKAYDEGGLEGEKKDVLDEEERGESEKSSMEKAPVGLAQLRRARRNRSSREPNNEGQSLTCNSERKVAGART